jgi:hypothetical protein
MDIFIFGLNVAAYSTDVSDGYASVFMIKGEAKNETREQAVTFI